MSYVALYRKFRPQTFADVKGQEHVVRTLKNQIKNNKVGHAYLFTGTRGTGKTSVAKIMARAANCLSPKDGEPCCECENCRAISAGSFMDVVEMDAASNNGVDDIRNLIEETQYMPAQGKYKVFIIDEAHMITKAAFNAFLKTLEEPPSYAVFILATTEPGKLPQTILSRVQRYDFKRIPSNTIKENLTEIVEKEHASAQEKALDYIAGLGDGSMRDAVSLLDKCLAFSLGSELTYELVLEALGAADTGEFSQLLRSVYKGDCSGALEGIDAAVNEGKDISRFVSDFCGYLRNILLVQINPGAAEQITGMSAENMELLSEDAALTDEQTIIRYIKVLSELINKMRFSSVKRLLTEVEIIKLARPQMETDYSSLLDRIRQLEARPAAEPGPALQSRSSKDGAAKEDKNEISSDEPERAQNKNTEDASEPDDEHGAEAGLDWDAIVNSVSLPSLKTSLKKSQAVKENGKITVYLEGLVAKMNVEKNMGELRQALKAAGYDEEITIKEGVPEVEDAIFKNIKFKVTQEEF